MTKEKQEKIQKELQEAEDRKKASQQSINFLKQFSADDLIKEQEAAMVDKASKVFGQR